MRWFSWPLFFLKSLASISAEGQVYGQKWGFRNFLKNKKQNNNSPIHFVPGVYPYRASLMTMFILVFLESISVLWWPNIWPKMRFLDLFEKKTQKKPPPNYMYWLNAFIYGIYNYGMSLMTAIYFRVPSVNFVPLVAKYLTQNGVSRTFWKTIGSIHFIVAFYPYGVSLLNKFGPSGDQQFKYMAENGVKKAQFIFTRGQYWPSGIVVACVCPSVRPSVRPSVTKFVRAITHHPLKLG